MISYDRPMGVPEDFVPASGTDYQHRPPAHPRKAQSLELSPQLLDQQLAAAETTRERRAQPAPATTPLASPTDISAA